MVPATCVPTDSSKFAQKSCLIISNDGPSLETTTLVIETHMIKAVSEQIPANASFFRRFICTFQRRLVETSMTKTSVRARIFLLPERMETRPTGSICRNIKSRSRSQSYVCFVSSTRPFTFDFNCKQILN